MTHLAFMSAVLTHTPIWVWVLLLLLIALGLTQTRPQRLTLRRAMALQALMLGLPLWGLLVNFPGPAAPFVWALCALVCATWGQRRMALAGVRWSATEGRFHRPGSWVPLVLMLGIFSLKYSVGVSLALQPALRGDPAFVLTVSAGYGLFSGLFAARALALWRLRRLRDLHPA